MTDTTTSDLGAASAAPRRVVHKFPFTAVEIMSMVLTAPRIVLVDVNPSWLDSDGQAHGFPCVWIEHLVDAPADHPRLTQLDVKFVGDGMTVGVVGWQHCGSTVIGPFVWHVYCQHHLIIDPLAVKSAATVVPKP